MTTDKYTKAAALASTLCISHTNARDLCASLRRAGYVWTGGHTGYLSGEWVKA